MFKLNLISFCDAPKPWGMYFQDSASPQMEVLVELHNNIMFYLVIISFGVGLILLSRIINYVSNKSWTLFSSTGNAISTNTKLSMVSKILSAFYQYNKYKNMRNQIRNKVDIVFCAVRPNTLVSIEGKKLRIDRQAVFVYCKTPLVNWTHLILDNPLLSYECYVLNAGTLKIGKWASVTIDGRHCNGYLYLNDIPNDINYWNVVCIQYNKMAYINIEQTCDITTMGYHVRHQFQSGDLPGGKFKILHLIAIKNSFATAKDVQNFKSRL